MPNRCLGELSRRSPDVWQSAGRGHRAGRSLTAVALAARALLIVCGPTAGHSQGAHDQRRLDTVHKDAGVSVLHHRHLPSGHLDASRGRQAPAGQPTRQRSCQAERGRPGPRAAHDLHQQQPGDLGGRPGHGGQGGPPPRHSRYGRSGQLQGMTVGSSRSTIGASLGQRHCRSVPATSLEGPGRGRRPVLRARRTARSEAYRCTTVSLRALRGAMGLARGGGAVHDEGMGMSWDVEDRLAWR
jgi:hypothetical protein